MTDCCSHLVTTEGVDLPVACEQHGMTTARSHLHHVSVQRHFGRDSSAKQREYNENLHHGN